MTGFDADVAVVGLGAFGSQALWRLAARGLDVIGFERHGIGHDQGSSHGQTRLFRLACREQVQLGQLAGMSRDLFRELETETGASLLDQTGGLIVGQPDGSLVTGTMKTVEANGLDVEVLTADEVIERFPQHHTLDRRAVGVLDPNAGVLRPEAAVTAACSAASSAGATIFDRTTVRSIDVTGSGVTVETALRSFRVEQVVVTAGAWLGLLAPELPLQPRRLPMLWFAPRDDVPSSEFDLAQFPPFYREVAEGHQLWGHGRLDGMQVKVGPNGDPTRDRSTHPDRVDRGTTPDDWRYVVSMLTTALPGLATTPSRVLPCMATFTPDEQFVVGRVGGSKLLVGGGDSAHGFKHSAAVGEVLAAATTGEAEPLDVAFMDPNRFQGR